MHIHMHMHMHMHMHNIHMICMYGSSREKESLYKEWIEFYLPYNSTHLHTLTYI